MIDMQTEKVELKLPESPTLHFSAYTGLKDAVQAFIDAGVNIEERLKGQTPLHYAARGGYVEVVRLLLKAGAKVDEKDKDGLTALDLAVAKPANQRHADVAQVLLGFGAVVSKSTEKKLSGLLRSYG